MARTIRTLNLALGGVHLLGAALAVGVHAGVVPAPARVAAGCVVGVWAAGSFLLGLTGAGRLLLARLVPGALGGRSVAADWVFAHAAGFWAVGCLWFLLALLGVLSTWSCLVVGAALLLLSWSGLPAAPPAPAKPDGQWRWLRWVLAGAVLVWALPYVVQTLLPGTDWDGEVYHLPLAVRFLEGRIAEADPYLPHFDFPGGMSLCYAAFLALDLEAAILPFNLFASGLLLVAVWALAADLWDARTAWWSAAVMGSLNLVWELGLDPRLDGCLALQLTVAGHALLAWGRDRSRSGLLPVLGMALGNALGLKYTALLPAAGIGLVVLWLGARAGRPAWPRLAAGALCLLLPAGFWYLRNGIQLGDPVYPMTDRYVFHDAAGRLQPFEPRIQAVIARAGAVPSEYLEGTTEAQAPGHFWNLWDVLLHPERYENKPYHFLGPLVFVGLLLPMFRRGRREWGLFLLGFVPFAVLASIGNLTRLVMPAFPFLAVGSGLLLARLRRVAAATAMVLVGLSYGHGTLVEWPKLLALHPASWLGGREERLDWLARAGFNGVTCMPRLGQFVRRSIQDGSMPADARLLMVGEAKGRFLSCAYLPDEGYQGYRWLVEIARTEGDLESIRRSLLERRIEWLVINTGYLQWVVHNIAGKRTRVAFTLWTLDQFVRRFGQVVWSADSLYLVRVRSG